MPAGAGIVARQRLLPKAGDSDGRRPCQSRAAGAALLLPRGQPAAGALRRVARRPRRRAGARPGAGRRTGPHARRSARSRRAPTGWRGRSRRAACARATALAVQLPNGPEFLDLFLACLKLGALIVPVNVLYREREVAPHPRGRRAHGARDGGGRVGLGPGGRDRLGRRGALGRGRSRARDPARRRPRRGVARGDRLHLGHHRAGQGGGAHPRQPRRERARAARGVAHHGRGPLPGGAAALPRARPRQRRLLVARERLPHAARGALRERQGAGALRGVPADALLRRADRVRAPARVAGRGRRGASARASGSSCRARRRCPRRCSRPSRSASATPSSSATA